MGKGMAENLVTKVELLDHTFWALFILSHNISIQGHAVLAYDVTAEAVSDIVGKGAHGASGPAEVCGTFWSLSFL